MIARAALVAGPAALVLPSIGQRVIASGDEARSAILAEDMLARGTWFDARVRDQRYRNKPLLYPWAIKVLSMPQGRVTETTAQVPVAVAALAGGVLAVAGYACWMLLAGRPPALVAGVALGTAALLVGGGRLYDRWQTRSEDYPALAALAERCAEGGDLGITGGRFFSIDFYLGRALTPLRSPSDLETWLTRPDRPVVVATGRAWRTMRSQVRTDVEVVDGLPVRSQPMLLLRRQAP